jgi:hypothetical protein
MLCAMSKPNSERRGQTVGGLLGFMRGVIDDIDMIIECWTSSDKEVRELMAIMGPGTGGFEKAGRYARRHVDDAIRHLYGRVTEVAPFVDATLAGELQSLLDMLDLDEYVPNTYGDISDRWRQMWAAAGLEKPMLRVRRQMLAEIDRAQTIRDEWARYPELGEPSALELASPRSAPQALRSERGELPSTAEAPTFELQMERRAARARDCLEGRELEVYVQYLNAVARSPEVDGSPKEAHEFLQSESMGTFSEMFSTWKKALERARRKMGELKPRKRADAGEAPDVASIDEI